MLLTLTTTHRPATDLGYLLHKNPARLQSFELSFGRAHVFYPEATEERCTAAVLLEVDPVGLVRGAGSSLDQYVNDRPYAATSFLSVSIADLFGTALGGRSKERPELAEQPIPLELRIPVLPCRGGAGFLRRLFEPLGYAVEADPIPRDEAFPEWGASRYFAVTLRAEKRVAEALAHLYVLIPVLDDEKHYWVGEAELEKLLRRGGAVPGETGGWLAAHPERAEITRRYLRRQKSLVREALARLEQAEGPDPDVVREGADAEEDTVERKLSLNEQRPAAVVAGLKEVGARRVLDLGCGEGRLLRLLIRDRQFEEIVGMDVSYRTLEIARERLHLDRLPPHRRDTVKLLHGSLIYRDRRLEGYDAAAVVEVIEHLDPPRLAAFERALFEAARPQHVLLTTPNREYNVRWESLPAGRMRHRDHRFEWTRSEFRAWADRVAQRLGYAVEYRPVGPDDPEVGAPTQMALFSRNG